MFPDNKAALKVYLNNAYGMDSMATFLESKQTWTVDKPEIFYLNLDALHLKVDNNELVCKEGFEELLRKPTRSPTFVIGQHSEPVNYHPVPAHQATDAQKKFWTAGILRILGKEHRADMPDTKKHELFIPVPREFAENYQQFIQTATAFRISPEAIERFHELADQRTDIEEDLPYHLKGMKRNDKNQLRLKQGDLVYFRPDDDNPNIVAEVSFSAHWRGRVENQAHQAANVFNFFPQDLLPFNSKRKTLSPAELLFGFIEAENIQGVKPENALAFAGKVRIGTGRITSEERLEPETTLKILASPKLPSPALYFRTQSPAQVYIAKHALNPKEHEAKGRKHYLHAMRQTNNAAQVQKLSSTGGIANGGDARFPWQTRNTDNVEQKVKITPIQANTTFKFDLDFDNLSAYELGLLCYALKPSDSYRHKLGMGKPIGLGTVNIDITELALIDRHERYAVDAMTTGRYNGETLNIENLRNEFINTMDKDIHHTLELLGNPHNVKAPVHYPQVRAADIEEETYRWFVANDKGSGRGQHRIPATKKSLTAIDSSSTQLPTLERYEWSE
jgi:CRISPR-associated protein (TIGR03986 family)